MSNFRGYYVKIGNCEFNDPAIKRDGLLIMPHLVQTADSGVVASGKIELKELPHTRTKIQMAFPPMTLEQYKRYYAVIMASMSLPAEYWNEGIDAYENGIFYHNDMQYKPAPQNGEHWVEMQEIHLIER